MRRFACAAALLASTVVGTGCTRDDQVEGTAATAAPATTEPPTTEPSTTQPSTTQPSTSAPSTAPATTGPIDTTIEPTIDTTTTTTATTAPPATAPSTTIAAGPLTLADLVLRADGIGPLDFGDTDDDVIVGLTQALGQAADDRSDTYPIEFDDVFVTEDDDAFVAPFARTVCYTNDLCVQFGGPDTEHLAFVGWELQSDNEPHLFTAAGITMGSSWADVLDAITILPFACYSYAYGDADGVDIGLLSTGEPFSIPSEDGAPTQGHPDPADVTVVAVSAGNHPYYLYDDC